MGTVLVIVGATVVAGLLLVGAAQVSGADGTLFAFLVVWIPMVWLGTVSRVLQPRLPRSYHELCSFESSGHVYELLGVRLAKRLLRRGPIAVFNPDLHLPPDRTPEQLVHLDQRMRDAEASHAILLVATLGVAGCAAAREWWTAAGLILLFDLLMNGYPVMLQRYNRALLRRRYSIQARKPGGRSGGDASE